jgi:hypothetical protein
MTAVVAHLAHRRDQIVACPTCGRQVRRKARQQIYCSGACRKRAFEAERGAPTDPPKKANDVSAPRDCEATDALKNGGRRPDSGAPTNPPKKINGANSLQALKSQSRVPPDLWREILAVEVFGGRDWLPVVSSGGVTCEVGKLRPRALVSTAISRAGARVRGGAR